MGQPKRTYESLRQYTTDNMDGTWTVTRCLIFSGMPASGLTATGTAKTIAAAEAAMLADLQAKMARGRPDPRE